MELHDKENKTASLTAWIYMIRKTRQRAQLHGIARLGKQDSKSNCMDLYDKENKTTSLTTWIYMIRKTR